MKPVPPSSDLPIQKSELLTLKLVSDIHSLINAAKAGLAATVNSALTMLYWHIGTRIHTEVLQGERAAYGEQVITLLAGQLEAEHGRGFSVKICATCYGFLRHLPLKTLSTH